MAVSKNERKDDKDKAGTGQRRITQRPVVLGEGNGNHCAWDPVFYDSNKRFYLFFFFSPIFCHLHQQIIDYYKTFFLYGKLLQKK